MRVYVHVIPNGMLLSGPHYCGCRPLFHRPVVYCHFCTPLYSANNSEEDNSKSLFKIIEDKMNSFHLSTCNGMQHISWNRALASKHGGASQLFLYHFCNWQFNSVTACSVLVSWNDCAVPFVPPRYRILFVFALWHF